MAMQRCLVVVWVISLLPGALCGEAALRATAVASNLGEEPLAEATPAPTIGVEATIKELKFDMEKAMDGPTLQWVVALFGLLIGGAAMYNGKDSFKWIIIATLAAVGFVFTTMALRSLWTPKESDMTTNICIYVGAAEIALCVAYVCYKGFDGVRVGIGLCVGGFLFSETKVLMEVMMKATFLDAPMMYLIVGSAFLLIGLGMFSQKMQGITFGLLAPAVGAAFLVSSIAFLVMYGLHMFMSGMFPTEAPLPGVLDFFLMLVKLRQGTVVGFFAATNNNTTWGSFTIYWDVVLGRIFWFVFAVLAMYVQLKRDAKKRKIENKNSNKGELSKSLIVKKIDS